MQHTYCHPKLGKIIQDAVYWAMPSVPRTECIAATVWESEDESEPFGVSLVFNEGCDLSEFPLPFGFRSLREAVAHAKQEVTFRDQQAVGFPKVLDELYGLPYAPVPLPKKKCRRR